MSVDDLPGLRVPYDMDGSFGAHLDANALYQADLTVEQLEALNNQTDDLFNPGDGYAAIVFAEPWDLSALYVNKGHATSYSRGPEYSLDTTNGSDGTWASIGTVDSSAIEGAWHSNHVAVDPVVEGVKGFRFGATDGRYGRGDVRAMHLYGTPTGDNGLALWSPSQPYRLPLSDLNLQTTWRGATPVVGFRVHNYSDAETAEGVTVQDASLDGDYGALLEFSTDGGSTWSPSVTLGNLAPGGTSPVVEVRVPVGAAQALGVWAARLSAEATDWV